MAEEPSKIKSRRTSMQFRPFIVVLLTIITWVAANAQGKSQAARPLFPIEQNKKWGVARFRICI